MGAVVSAASGVFQKFNSSAAAIALSVGAVALLALALGVGFPHFTASYIAQGGPVWLLLLLLPLALIAGTASKKYGTVPKTLFYTAMALFAFWVGYSTIEAWTWGTDTVHVASVTQKQKHRAAPDLYTRILQNAMGTSPACNVPRHRQEVGTTPFRFNPDGKCSTIVWFPANGCVMYIQAKTEREFGPYGYCSESKGLIGPPDAEYIRSAQGAILVEYQLGQPVYQQVLR